MFHGHGKRLAAGGAGGGLRSPGRWGGSAASHLTASGLSSSCFLIDFHPVLPPPFQAVAFPREEPLPAPPSFRNTLPTLTPKTRSLPAALVGRIQPLEGGLISAKKQQQEVSPKPGCSFLGTTIPLPGWDYHPSARMGSPQGFAPPISVFLAAFPVEAAQGRLGPPSRWWVSREVENPPSLEMHSSPRDNVLQRQGRPSLEQELG